MNKNLRVGVLAGLLLAPGAIAHANEGTQLNGGTQIEQVPFNTFAAVSNKQVLMNVFATVNENSTSALIATNRGYYNGLNVEEKTELGAANIELIAAKLDYLEDFAGYKNRATNLEKAIDKLILTSKTLITDTEAAEKLHFDLVAEFDNELTTLSNKAEAANTANGDNTLASALLASLVHYSGDADAFVTSIVTKTLLDTLESRTFEIVDPKSFIDNEIAEIVASAKDPFDKAAYETAIENARLAYDAFATQQTTLKIVNTVTLDSGITAQKTLTNAEADFVAAAKVDTLMTEIKNTTFTSATTFKSKVSAVQSAYNALTSLQKNLVNLYDEIEPYIEVIDMIDAIDQLKVATTEQWRADVRALLLKYNVDIVTEFKPYVTNNVKLIEMEQAIVKAEAVETLISAIKTENAATAVPEARVAYKALTTTENKHVGKEFYDVLAAWEKSSTTAATVVKQINAIIVSKSDFVSKTQIAAAGYSNIAAAEGQPATKEQLLVTNAARLLALQPFAEIANKVNTLKVTSATYAVDLADVSAQLTAWVTPTEGALTQTDVKEISDLKVTLQEKLDAATTEQAKASELVARIEALKTTVNLVEMVAIRTAYNDKTFSSNGKKLVTNIKALTDLEKQYKAALNIENLIIKLPVFTDKGYAKKVVAIETAYKKVPQNLQTVITSYASLTGTSGLLAIAKSMIEIDALKSTAKDFNTKLTTARTNYSLVVGSTAATLNSEGMPVAAIDYFITVYGPKLAEKENVLQQASEFDAEITALKTLTGETFMSKLEDLTKRYKALKPDIKNNVTNAKDLTNLERDYKTSLKVYNLIETLPANTDKTFAKKVEAAEKAYQKLTVTQKGYVYNYTTKLVTVLKVADLIGRIDQLKISSKTYETDVKAIRAEYDVLSDTDKALVYNYKNLEAAESNMSDAQVVMTLIDAALPNAEEFIAKLTAARAAYDALDKTQQKLVLNYKELTAREKSVKPVLTLDKQITELNTSNVKTFLSKYKTALKAYEKLSYAERGLLLNENQLITILQPLYNVIDQINSIKSSSKTFVSDTQSVRAAYNALTPDQQAQIGNYSTLQDHELNVTGGASVDALIKALKSNAPKEYVQKVKEARIAYNALSSANKKAVSLADTLKDEEKYVKPVETVIDLIEGLSNPRNDLSKQFDKVNKALQKLNAEQITFISNYDKYSDLTDVISVYQLIAKLKPSDKYYLGNLQAAKLAYDKLTMEDKLRVTNYYKLQEAEQDVTEIERVTNIVASLSSSSSTYFADIEAALAAYKTLPSASRKQVLNYANLQAAEKNMKAAQKVMKSIEELDSNLRNFESKTKATLKAYDKLTDDQKKIVSNYNLLQSYAFDLGL